MKTKNSHYIASWTHVKEIEHTKLLISLHHSRYESANIAVFDISHEGCASKIYNMDEIRGGNLLLLLLSDKSINCDFNNDSLL